jgi:hypothetical protein
VQVLTQVESPFEHIRTQFDMLKQTGSFVHAVSSVQQ